MLGAILYVLSFCLVWLVIYPGECRDDRGQYPTEWAGWRLRWESGHLLNAVLQIIGFAALLARAGGNAATRMTPRHDIGSGLRHKLGYDSPGLPGPDGCFT